jgi:NAD+ kinase
MPIKKIAIYGGSFNPPGKHHIKAVKLLARKFDRVIVVPCGGRGDKNSSQLISNEDRAELIRLAFESISGVAVDFSDIYKSEFTRTYDLDKKYQAMFFLDDIYHVVGGDLVTNGASDQSEIQTSWYKGKQLWEKLNFIVLARKGYEFNQFDLPPKAHKFRTNFPGSSTEIRKNLYNNESIKRLVSKQVAQYIFDNKLYFNNQPNREVLCTS